MSSDFSFIINTVKGQDFIISEVSSILKFYGSRQSLFFIMKRSGVMISFLKS